METFTSTPEKTLHGFTLIGRNADGKYEIESTDIRALFFPYTGALCNLFVTDRDGNERDVVVGHDDPEAYKSDGSGLRLGGISGENYLYPLFPFFLPRHYLAFRVIFNLNLILGIYCGDLLREFVADNEV